MINTVIIFAILAVTQAAPSFGQNLESRTSDTQLQQVLARLQKGTLMYTDCALLRNHPHESIPALLDTFSRFHPGVEAANCLAEYVRASEEDPAQKDSLDTLKDRLIEIAQGQDNSQGHLALTVLRSYRGDTRVRDVLRARIAKGDKGSRLNAMREYRMWSAEKSNEEKDYLRSLAKDPFLLLAIEAAEMLKSKYGLVQAAADVKARFKPIATPEEAIELMRGGDPFEVGGAREFMERRGQASIPAVIQLLSEMKTDGNREETYNVIERILRKPEPKERAGMEAALKHVEDSDKRMRYYVADILDHYTDHPEAQAALVKMASTDNDPDVRMSAVNRMTSPWADSKLDVLRGLLKTDRELAVRMYAAAVLARHGDSAGRPLAIATITRLAEVKELKGNEPVVRFQRVAADMAVNTLERVGIQEDLPLIASFAKTPAGQFSHVREAVREIKLRAILSKSQQIQYLQSEFEGGDVQWASYKLGEAMEERPLVDYLNTLMRKTSAKSEVRERSRQVLMARGWLDPEQRVVQLEDYKLLPKPLWANEAEHQEYVKKQMARFEEEMKKMGAEVGH